MIRCVNGFHLQPTLLIMKHECNGTLAGLVRLKELKSTICQFPSALHPPGVCQEIGTDKHDMAKNSILTYGRVWERQVSSFITSYSERLNCCISCPFGLNADMSETTLIRDLN